MGVCKQYFNQVERMVNDPAWGSEGTISWAQTTIETGVKNIAATVYADRVE